VLYATSNLEEGEKMRQYLVEYGTDEWRDWTVVATDDMDDAETVARGRFPVATWAVVVDDVTGMDENETEVVVRNIRNETD
jgi:hypothetical protein